MDELLLIKDAKRGDLDSFNTLVLEYQELVFNTAYRIMGEEESAADATQEAFISAFTHINSFRGGSFKSWLLRTVTNACYDILRTKKRRPTTPLEPLSNEDEEIESPAWIADPDSSPSEEFEKLELEHAIQHCLENLPMDYRTVIILADIQEMDYMEVATATKNPLGTVKSRLARARLRMRECLQDFWELLPSSFRLDSRISQ
ncbi:MAG TPA: sigma-70 family RNA polymerase sigma factor [Anaerolineales bacterium]|nr:sigma-70 family RNA polymerase sigma factor [Anaerolineales bacterium]